MPLLWISLAFLSGILLSPDLPLSKAGWSLAALISLVLFIPPLYRRLSSGFDRSSGMLRDAFGLSTPALIPLMIVFFSLGAIRYQLSQPVIDPSFISYYNDQPSDYVIEGTIEAPPDVRDTYINLRLRVNKLQTLAAQVTSAQATPVKGLLLVVVGRTASYSYGDRIQVQGKLLSPPEDENFSYRDYLANRGIYSYMAFPATSLLQSGQGSPFYAALYTFRQRALDVIYAQFTDPEAGLLSGILLGVQSGIPAQLQEAFRQTGTSHIIVISGFNITIIAALFTFLFSRILGRYKGAIATAAGIFLYTLLVGANAAVVRAAILGLMTLLGHLVGRRQTGVNSLTFVAAVMAIISPTVLWDVSFQLSFAATLGLVLYAEPMISWFIRTAARRIPQDKAEKIAGPVGEYFLLTLAAQLTTLPLMIYYFKRLSLTALVANPLILPAQPPLMILGGMAVLLGMVLRPLGQIFAWAAWPFTAYTIRVVEWLATIPHGSIPLGQIALPLILLFYVMLFAVTFVGRQIPPLVRRLSPVFPLVALAVATVLVWKAALYAPDSLLHVTILNVGTGEGVLIQSPTGRNMLINGGSSTTALSESLGRRLSPFSRSLDWLVIADVDGEDILGIPTNLGRFTPSNVLWAGNAGGTQSASDLQSQLVSLSIPVTSAQPGQALDLGSEVMLQILTIDPRGADLLLTWGNFRMLLPMGLDFAALEAIQNDSAMRNFSAVLIPESGFAPLNPPGFIKSLNPSLAILSVAPGDKSGLPSPETLQALQGYNVLRTDQNGWIQITTDGKRMWVEVERK